MTTFSHHHHPSFQELCLKTLKESGARLTRARMALIESLESAREPLAPKEILQKTQDRLKGQETVDSVTIYRILDRFCELGLVHQVAPSGGYLACTHLACTEQPHIMTYCTQCRQADEIHVPDEVMAPLLWFLRSQNKFEAKKHLFQLDGTCASCRQDLRVKAFATSEEAPTEPLS